MRKLFIISAIFIAVAFTALALHEEPVKSFTVSGDGADIVVYNHFPDRFNETTVAATNMRGTVWLDASRLNKTEMRDYCDRLVLKNMFRPVPEITEQWYIDVAEKDDREVCVEAVNQSEENGFL